LTRAQAKREEEWAAQAVGKSQGRAIEAREEFDAAVADIMAFVNDASPDPGQAILARLKAGDALATDTREVLARRKALGPKGAEDFQAAYLREASCRVNVEIALAARDKAVGRDD